MTGPGTIQRKLFGGIVVGISISETSGMQHRGFDVGEVNRLTRVVSQDLLAEGASVVLGHDWRSGGIMWEILRVAQSYQPSVSLLLPDSPLLQNWIPWPDPLPLEEEDREALKGVLRIQSAGLPDELQQIADEKIRTEPGAKPYFRARALTHMRRAIVSQSHARVCVGGRTEGSSGRFPGIIEEAYLTIEAQNPLYVSSLLSGASEHIVRALQGQAMPDDFALTRDDVKKAFDTYAATLESGEPDAQIGRDEIWKQLAEFGVDGLAATNGLTAEENQSIFSAQNVSEIRYWLLRGLNRLRANGNYARICDCAPISASQPFQLGKETFMASNRLNETRGKRPPKLPAAPPKEKPGRERTKNNFRISPPPLARGKRWPNAKQGSYFSAIHRRDNSSEQLLHSVTEHSMAKQYGLETAELREHIGEVLPEFTSQAEATYSATAAPRAAGLREAEPIDAWYGSFGTRLSRVMASRTDNPYSAAEIVAEVIIGEDDRRRVFETTNYPYGCICFLSIVSRSGVRFVGTGWMVDAQTVVTAGHCIYMHREGGWAASIDIYPGRNGPDKPFAAKAARVWSTRGWTESMNAPADYGAIRLDGPISEVGSFGYAAESDTALRTAICNVVGYPADKDGEMWGHARRLGSIRSDTLVYDIDTYGGNSGAPLVVVTGGVPVVAGIHNYGDYSGNSATRITPIVYQNIEGWVKAD